MKKPAKEPSRGQESMWAQLLIPLAALVRGDLLALVHSSGMQAVAAMLEAQRTKLCGERYRHDASRRATRAGSTRGELALAVAGVALRRPRAVDRDGHEVGLDTWAELASTDPLDVRALEQMAVGVATRKYARSLEKLPDGVQTRGTSKSAVSRRFVALTTDKLAELDGAPARRARYLGRVHRRHPLRRARRPVRARHRRDGDEARPRCYRPRSLRLVSP